VVDELWFSANDVLLAKSGTGQVVGWQRRSVAPSMLVPQILRHRGNVLSQVYVDENTLATAGLASDGVCLWDTRTGDCTTRLPVQGGQVRALAVGDGGQVLGVGVSTGRVYLWDTKTALPLRVLDVAESAVRGLAFDTSGAQLFTAGAKGELAVWASSSGRNVWSARTPDGVFDAAFDARSDSFWVTTRAGGLEVWDQSGRRNFRLVVHADWAMGLALHQATQRFATIGAGGALALGQTASKHVQLNVTGHVGRGLSVDISPDGALLATGAEDGVVLLWQAQPMRLLAQLPHHRGAVRSVRFSPRGTMLSSAGDDGTVR